MAAEQHGVLSVTDLRGCGLTDRMIAGRVRHGRLHRLHRRVYAVGHTSLSLEGIFLAAVKAGGGRAVLSHISAAALWGLLDWDQRNPEITLVVDGPRPQPGLRVHRTKLMPMRDVRRRDGIPVTSPARTLIDLASLVEYRALRHAVRQAQALCLLHPCELIEALDRLGRRRGVGRLRRMIAGGTEPTRSELEDVVLDLIERGGLALPDVNVPLLVSGRRVVPDFCWPREHLIVEADGAAWHDNRIAREDDAERQALLEADGERVIRLTWDRRWGAPPRSSNGFAPPALLRSTSGPLALASRRAGRRPRASSGGFPTT
jgi:hypothetical protein